MARNTCITRAEPTLDLDKARQLLKVTTVILRDHTYMRFEEAALAFAWCWNHTESLAESERRERNT